MKSVLNMESVRSWKSDVGTKCGKRKKLELRIDRPPPLSTPSLLLIPRGTGAHGRVVVTGPRGRETAVPGVGAPVGATVGDGVGTKYGKREKLEG